MTYRPLIRKPIVAQTYLRNGEVVFKVDGQFLRYSDVTKRWTCSEHGPISYSILQRRDEQFKVCWLCITQKMNVSSPVRITDVTKLPRKSEADELADLASRECEGSEN